MTWCGASSRAAARARRESRRAGAAAPPRTGSSSGARSASRSARRRLARSRCPPAAAPSRRARARTARSRPGSPRVCERARSMSNMNSVSALRDDEEEAHGVAADLVDQVAQRHVAAGALADLHFLAAAHHRDHLVQHVVGIARRECRCPIACRPARTRVTVLWWSEPCTLITLREAALPLGHVVRDVGHEVRVAAVGLAHHAVLVVAVVGGAAATARLRCSYVLPDATSRATVASTRPSV